MEKREVLSEVTRLAGEGNLTEAELHQALALAHPGSVSAATESSLGLVRNVTAVQILYYFGGLVAFIGVTILLAQNWAYLPDTAKVLFTAVMGAALLAGGIYLTKFEKYAGVGQAFMLAGSLIFPVGIYVILKIAYIDISDLGVQSFTTAGIAAIFLASYWQFRKVILLFFGIFWATVCYFFLGSFLLRDNTLYFPNYFWYQLVLAGLCYILIDYYYAQAEDGLKRLSGVLNAFGIIAFLTGTFALGLDNHFWELIFPLFALGAMLVSVKVHSRMFLVAGAGGLIAYIFVITGRYFAESVGWPVALIIAGFALIGIGYFAVQVNSKYFAKKKAL